jgi:hypothetical protein
MGGLIIVIGGMFGKGGLYIGLVIGLLFVGFSYWFSDKLAIAAARGVPVTREEAPDYYRIVDDLHAAGGPSDAAVVYRAVGSTKRIRNRSRPQARGCLCQPRSAAIDVVG